MNDLIDRQAALDIFKPWLDVKGYSEGELNMLRAVIYELETMPNTSAWISVKDKMPETCGNVLTYTKHDKVTHWMSFPEPPESGDEE